LWRAQDNWFQERLKKWIWHGVVMPPDAFCQTLQSRSVDSTLTPPFEEIMSENIKHISDASFEVDVLKSDKPVLVDFWAEWCGPCKSIAPILEEIAKEYDGKLQIAKMDVDANQAVPAKFGIRGIPTLILFKNGVPAAQKVGALAKGQLTSFIDSNI
jgi:thioredoxin 1